MGERMRIEPGYTRTHNGQLKHAQQRDVVTSHIFADAFKTQRVLHAAIESARHRAPVTVDDL